MPSRTNRLVAVVLVGVLVLGAGGYLAWTVVFQSTPQVQSQLLSFDTSEHQALATLTVAREGASTEAVCRLQALGVDHSVVGEITVPVTEGPATQTLTVPIRTDRKATSVASLG